METLDIKELKEIVKFCVELGEAFDRAYADKKLDIADLALIMAPIMQVGAAFEGLDKVSAEVKDLSSEELAELKTFVEGDLDLRSDRTEAIIEEGIAVAGQLLSYVKLFKKA